MKDIYMGIVVYLLALVIIKVIYYIVNGLIYGDEARLRRIKLWKSKEYTTRKTPLYAVSKDLIDRAVVVKYEQAWRETNMNEFWFGFFPIPFEWQTWGYIKLEHYPILIENKHILYNDLADHLDNINLKEIWESNRAAIEETIAKHEEASRTRKSAAEILNKEFNENYI